MSEQLPSRQKTLNLLLKAGCSQKIIEHCKAVATIAIQIAKACKKKKQKVNIQLVEIGALLHDIGRSKTHSVDHTIVGMEIAESLGLPDTVISIIGRHVGGGIPTDEAEKLGWPPKDYLPQTLEEKIVTYADKLIEGLRKVPIEQTLEKLSWDLGETHPAIERVKKLHAELSSVISDLDANNHTA